MLSTKSELLKEGELLFEQFKAKSLTLYPSWLGQRKNESDEDFKMRCEQIQLLEEDFKDWREYVRLYVFRNQIIPEHYDEFMESYKTQKFDIKMMIRRMIRIVETCK